MKIIENNDNEPKVIKRPSFEKYYLNIAKAVSERSTCLRRHYGAVIVKDNRIVSTGYNGSASGEVNCCDRGVCKREELKIPHGERYEMCEAVHAEQNAILQASASEMKNAVMYVYGYDCIEDKMCSGKACKMCNRFIRNSGIRMVVISDPDNNDGYSKINVKESKNLISCDYKAGIRDGKIYITMDDGSEIYI